MKTIVIGKNDAGQRIDKFLTKTFKNLPTSLMYKYIRKKRIKLNGTKCNISDKLSENDVMTLYINDEFFQKQPESYDFMKAPKKLDIVYEDENIILLNKKPGLIVHPDENYFFDSLIARLTHYLFDKGEYDPKLENSFAPALINRIDRNTSGIVIAAKNTESLRILNEKMKLREIHKYYLTLLHGTLNPKSKTLTAYLRKNESQNRVYISSKPKDGYKIIKTKYVILKENNNTSLAEIELLTGRTHQIRAHMAFIGHPILGDGKYGTNSFNKSNSYKYQALCSYKLVFDFISDAGILNYLNHKEFKIDNIWFLKDL